MATERGPLRTLLVSTDADVLEGMRRAFSSADFTIVGEAWPGIDAVHRATDLEPEVILLHVEPPLGPAMRIIQGVTGAAPHAGVSVLSSTSDAELMRRAMNAGAHDFAVLPLSDESFRDAARRAAQAAGLRVTEEDPHAPAMGTVITVLGPRGGVGKTTIATNLAVSLSRETRASVALVDLDVLFGGTSIALGLMPEETIQEWLKARNDGGHAPPARFLAAHRTGVKLLSAPVEPDPEIDFTPEDVAALIGDLASTHEYVVIDTSASFAETTAAATELSSVLLLVTSPDLASIRATRFVANLLRAWEIDDDRMRLVVNHPLPFIGTNLETLSQAMRLPISWTLPYDRDVLSSADQGRPVSEARPRARLSREMTEIARYLGHIQPRPRKRLLGVF